MGLAHGSGRLPGCGVIFTRASDVCNLSFLNQGFGKSERSTYVPRPEKQSIRLTGMAGRCTLGIVYSHALTIR